MRDTDDQTVGPTDAEGAGPEPLAGTGALVTGGAGGIASASATRLAADGAVVVLMGRTEGTLASAVADVRAAVPGAEVYHVVGDALREEDVAAAVDEVVARAGALGATVATVGGGVVAPLLARTPDDLVEELRRNLVAPLLAIKRSVPAMVAGGGGSIVCISSDAATLSFRHMVGYCTAKAGVDAMVRVAADELGHLGIRVNAVRPGLTRTKSANIDRIFGDAELMDEFVRVKPLGRTGVPADVAEAVAFLAGPGSAWITGACLPVDGGNSLRMAPDMEAVARRRLGDPVVDAALAGRPPPAAGAGPTPG